MGACYLFDISQVLPKCYPSLTQEIRFILLSLFLKGPHRTIPWVLASMPKNTREDVGLLVTRLRQVKRQVEENIECMREGVR